MQEVFMCCCHYHCSMTEVATIVPRLTLLAAVNSDSWPQRNAFPCLAYYGVGWTIHACYLYAISPCVQVLPSENVARIGHDRTVAEHLVFFWWQNIWSILNASSISDGWSRDSVNGLTLLELSSLGGRVHAMRPPASCAGLTGESDREWTWATNRR